MGNNGDLMVNQEAAPDNARNFCVCGAQIVHKSG